MTNSPFLMSFIASKQNPRDPVYSSDTSPFAVTYVDDGREWGFPLSEKCVLTLSCTRAIWATEKEVCPILTFGAAASRTIATAWSGAVSLSKCSFGKDIFNQHQSYVSYPLFLIFPYGGGCFNLIGTCLNASVRSVINSGCSSCRVGDPGPGFASAVGISVAEPLSRTDCRFNLIFVDLLPLGGGVAFCPLAAECFCPSATWIVWAVGEFTAVPFSPAPRLSLMVVDLALTDGPFGATGAGVSAAAVFHHREVGFEVTESDGGCGVMVGVSSVLDVSTIPPEEDNGLTALAVPRSVICG